jgi:hypothetical protein
MLQELETMAVRQGFGDERKGIVERSFGTLS